MKVASLIFPHQLYQNHPLVTKEHRIILIEDSLFFYDRQYPIRFHKQKLLLHRASMKRYAAEQLSNHSFEYLDYQQISTYEQLFSEWKLQGIEQVCCIDPSDYLLHKRLQKASREVGLPISWRETPNFLLTIAEIKSMLPKTNHYSMASFYRQQRQQLQILMEDNKPVGGVWSYDEKNRKRYDSKAPLPPPRITYNNPYIDEATQYVETYFTDNPGEIFSMYYPTSSDEAERELDWFFDHAFKDFGPYEDAILQNNQYLFHSVLSPSLNIGLLNPKTIISQAIAVAEEKEIPMASLEGFLRQIISWREFMRGIYSQEGSKIRTSNFFQHTRPIPPSFWNGTTGILPIDSSIQNIRVSGYAHHIERLMILGNFMLLCEFDPDEVYRWFMTFFVDAYDWVMVPNVYSMSQYADGGLITTKPYISSSHYILRMSDYQQDSWTVIWDSLYWRFISKHQALFLKNPRMRMMVRQWQKKSALEKDQLLKTAEHYLANLI